MKLPLPSLSQHLAKNLANIYLLYGNEHFLIQESSHAICSRIKEIGEVEHLIITEPGEQLCQQIEQRSLFALAKIVEIKIAKPNAAFISAITTICEMDLTDCYIMIQMQSLSRAQQQAKWFTLLEKKGIVIAHWPLTGNQFTRWVDDRLARNKIKLEPELRMRLLNDTEGNALAAAQEIDRLHLLNDTDLHFGSQSRFEVSELIEAALLKQPARVIKIVSYLKSSKEALPLVIWSLGQTLHALNHCTNAPTGARPTTLLQAGIRAQLHPLYLNALKDRPNQHWLSLLVYLFCVDKQLKSGDLASAWRTVLDLSLQMANSPVF
ncbi:MAG: DNA polymerase III subunit delta [Candidatus Berkiella sp.]